MNSRNRPDLRLPASWAVFLMPLFLSIFMTCLVSFIATATGIGLANDFVAKWLEAWATSWLIAFPVVLVMLPLVRRLVTLMCRPLKKTPP